MKVDKIYLMIMLLILFVVMGNAAANEEFDVDSLSGDGNSSIKLDSNQINDNALSDEINKDSISDSGEIEVEDWDELQYYCSLSDKNYNLKLKENTNYYPTNPNSNDYQIIVKNNVTITGSSGAYIGDSSPNARNITYTPIKVADKSGIGIVLQGITFKWISTSYQTDGVFLVLGGNVNNSIKDCTFSEISTYMGHSSILHIKYGNLDVSNCTFINCTTDFGCISVYCPDDDSTKTCTGASMDISDSYFEGNYARTEPGCINNCGILNVYNSTFYKNTAFWWAGAIHTHGGGNTSLYYSTFIDNVAGWNGGALYTYSYLQIYNSSFIGNNCTTNNGGGAIGACKYQHAPHIYIEGSLFKDNANNCWSPDQLSSGTGRGGAISIMDEGSIDVRNTTFIHNSASKGSAIAITSQSYYGSPNVRLIDNTFINNTKTGDVLYIYVSKFSNCEIANNTFINSTIELSKLRIDSDDPVDNKIVVTIDAAIKNSAAYDDDILDDLEYNVFVDGEFYTKIKGTEFIFSFNDEEKHDIFITSSTSGDTSNMISVSNKKEYIFVSKIYGDDSNDGRNRTSPVASISRAIELANDTGNIFIMDGTYNESNFTVTYDLVIVGGDDVIFNGSGDNLFKVTSSSMTIKNIVFSNMKQTNGNSRFISIDGVLNLQDCRFIGGVYYNAIDAGEIRLTNVVFNGVEYKYYLINAPILNADNLSVTNNMFSGSGSDKGFLYSSKVNEWNVLNSKFENNRDLRSGVIYIKGDTLSRAIIKNTVFKSNSLLYSKTSYTSCIYFTSNLNIDSCIFTDNMNEYVSSSPRSTVLYMFSKCNLDISNSIFINNTYGSGANGLIYTSQSNPKQITLGYNWYGNTIDDAAVRPELNSNINIDGWYLLNASSSPDKLGPGEKAIITFDLNNIVLKNGTVIPYDAYLLPQIKFNAFATNGVLDTNELTLNNGLAQVEFTKVGYDDSSITASYSTCDALINIIGTMNTPHLEIITSNITSGDDLNITVLLSGDATGETVLNFNGENYTLTFNEGISSKIIPKVEEGNYTISVIFKGDLKYLERTVTGYVTVKKLISSITLDANDTYVDEELKVIVSTVDEIPGNITIQIGDKILSKEIINKQAIFNISNIKAGNYTVTASYPGTIRYSSCEDKKNISILKYNSSIKLTLGEIQINTNMTITANVLNDMGGNVTFIVNGESETVEINNGIATILLNMIKGDYLIEAVYNGDDKYLSSYDSVEFSAGKLNSTLTVDVDDNDYGQNITVKVNTNSDATGNISLTIDNKSYTEEIKDGLVTVTLSGLTAGNKNITVFYKGDKNYLSSFNSTNFKINKIKPVFNVTANSAMVGEEVIVKININNDMRGNFTIKIGEKTYHKIISKFGQVTDLTLKDLTPDDYEVTVTYNGDNNYQSEWNKTAFSVFEYPYPQVSNEGIDPKNTHKSPYDTMANGEILFEIDMENNISGSIVIDSEGNIYFASNDSIYSYDINGNLIWKFKSAGVDSAFSGVSIARGLIISPKVGDRLYFINMTSGLENIHSNMYWGSSLFAPVIDDDYNIYTVSEYQYNDNDYKLVIIPYNIWQTSLEPVLIKLGNAEPISAPIIQDNTAIILNQNGMYIVDILNQYPPNMQINTNVRPIFGLGNTIYTFDGNKIVAINNQQKIWQTTVTGTVGNNLALDSEIGYLYSVNRQGVLYRYDIANGEESLMHDFNEIISSDILIDNDGNIYLGSEKGIFYALDNQGNILWRVNLNNPITGMPVMSENGLIYIVVNNSKIICIGNGEKISSNLTAKADNISVGENAIINITFDKIASGNMTIFQDNKVYDVYSCGNDGEIRVNIENLTYGNHSFEIIYSGDMRFKDAKVIVNVTVSKAEIEDTNQTFILPDVIDSSPIFSINLSGDATGNLTVYVGGKFYGSADLVNGRATVELSNLKSGNHDISIVYSGDEKYSSISKNISIDIPQPHVPIIKITGGDVSMLYTSGAKYQVRLTSDGVALSGKTVVFTVNGKTLKEVTDKNGYASVKINLPPKSSKYMVTATYEGVKISNNVKVKGLISAKNLKVKKSSKSLKIKVTLKKVNGKYLKSKKISLKFNGKTYNTKTNKKGVATFKITKKVIKKLKTGKKYSYKVTYLKETLNKKITVKK